MYLGSLVTVGFRVMSTDALVRERSSCPFLGPKSAFTYASLYRVSQEERSVFWQVILSVILSKNVCMYMCPIPNSFLDRAISLYSSLYVRHGAL
jgi:hypothetical protein